MLAVPWRGQWRNEHALLRREVAVAVAASVARTAQTEGVASSAVLRCLSPANGGGGDGARACVRTLQYDPRAAWEAAHR